MKSKVGWLCISLGLVAGAAFVLSQTAYADRPVRTGKSPATVREGVRPARLIDGTQVATNPLGTPTIDCAGVATAGLVRRDVLRHRPRLRAGRVFRSVENLRRFCYQRLG